MRSLRGRPHRHQAGPRRRRSTPWSDPHGTGCVPGRVVGACQWPNPFTTVFSRPCPRTRTPGSVHSAAATYGRGVLCLVTVLSPPPQCRLGRSSTVPVTIGVRSSLGYIRNMFDPPSIHRGKVSTLLTPSLSRGTYPVYPPSSVLSSDPGTVGVPERQGGSESRSSRRPDAE